MLIVGYSEPNYGDNYKYKTYAIVVGFILGLSPIVSMLGYSAYMVFKIPGNFLQVLSDLFISGSEWKGDKL